jgi:hypothetical protein
MIFDEEHLSRIEAQRCESPEVDRLVAQRTRFLQEHPHLMSLQEEIDELLATTLDPMIRLEILFMLTTDRLMEMRKVMTELMRLARYAGAER